MTREAILKAAIERAVANGWSEQEANFFLQRSERLHDAMLYGQLIWDHDFAKSLFGESIGQNPSPVSSDSGLNPLYASRDTYINKQGDVVVKPLLLAWQYHLQAMVVSPDPITYLGEWLKGETNGK